MRKKFFGQIAAVIIILTLALAGCSSTGRQTGAGDTGISQTGEGSGQTGTEGSTAGDAGAQGSTAQTGGEDTEQGSSAGASAFKGNVDVTGRYSLSRDLEAIIDDVDFTYYEPVSYADNNRVFYEIFVGSFSDSDRDGTGDLRGIIDRFDYLNDGDPKSGKSLGVEGIWLSPIFESPSYHKYDTTDYYKIDPKFGSMEDLKELAALCDERGVKLILDLVINHSGSQNEWFKKYCEARKNGDTQDPYYDFYSTADAAKVGTRSFTKVTGAPWYYESNFSNDMPEMNYDNEFVRETMLDVAKYYLEEIGVDGFRFDAAKYIYYGEEDRNVEFWKWYMGELRAICPDIYAVAEVWDSDSVTMRYAPALNCFAFSMAQPDGMIAAAAKEGDAGGYAKCVQSYLERVTGSGENATILPFLSNHDMDRAAGYMSLSTGYAKMAANLYILGPGSPFIYYGEEIGMKGSRGSSGTDANRRLAMLWGDGDTVSDPEGADYAARLQVNGTVADHFDDGSSLFNHYKRLIMIREANPEIASGSYRAVAFDDSPVGGFTATASGGTVGVFHNTTMEELTVDLSAAGADFYEITAVIGEGTAQLKGTMLTLGAQTSVVVR